MNKESMQIKQDFLREITKTEFYACFMILICLCLVVLYLVFPNVGDLPMHPATEGTDVPVFWVALFTLVFGALTVLLTWWVKQEAVQIGREVRQSISAQFLKELAVNDFSRLLATIDSQQILNLKGNALFAAYLKKWEEFGIGRILDILTQVHYIIECTFGDVSQALQLNQKPKDLSQSTWMALKFIHNNNPDILLRELKELRKNGNLNLFQEKLNAFIASTAAMYKLMCSFGCKENQVMEEVLKYHMTQEGGLLHGL